MNQFAPLGIFLILAFILPGLIITSTLMLFFPELRALIPSGGSIEFIGVVIIMSFINGHPAFLFERHFLDTLWNKIFPKLRIKERIYLADNRSQIIADAEINGLSHSHYDQTLGEFILFNNTSFWLFFISAIQIIRGPYTMISIIAVTTLLASFISLVFVSPFFKKSYIDILETLQKETHNTQGTDVSDAKNA